MMNMKTGKSGKRMKTMTTRNFSFNTQHLQPATGYHNKLMREIDDAYWLGKGDEAQGLELTASDVQRYIDKGSSWYPTF